MTVTTDPRKTGIAASATEVEFYNLSSLNLKKWRAALANVQTGAASAKVAIIGDSTDAGFYASGAQYAGNRTFTVADAVARRFVASGIPSSIANTYGTASVVTASLASYDPRWTYGAGWSASSVASVLGGYLLQNASDTTAANFTPTKTDGTALSFDTIEVVYLKNSAYANFTIGIDGGAASYTSTQAGSGALDTASVTVAAGTHTVNIAKTAGDAAKTLYIASIRCYDSSAKVVHFLNMAGGGMTSSNMAGNAAYYNSLNGIALAAPDLSVINCTINDALTSVPLTTYQTNLQNLITTCAVTGSVVLRTGNPGKAGYSGFVADSDEPYIAVMATLAQTNNIPFINVKRRLVSWTDANTYGLMVDGLHPTKLGYQDIANAVFSVIKP
jgi:lysophospholipase L1-like esterase